MAVRIDAHTATLGMPYGTTGLVKYVAFAVL